MATERECAWCGTLLGRDEEGGWRVYRGVTFCGGVCEESYVGPYDSSLPPFSLEAGKVSP